MASDLDIARAATLKPITDIATRAGIPADALEPYGKYKAKIGLDFIRTQADRPDGALVLVTGINPTPAGEGKTTTTVGLGARTFPWSLLWREGWGDRRRLCASAADGRYQSAFHRGFPRHHQRQ